MEFRVVTIVLMGLLTMSTLLALGVTETEARPSRANWAEVINLLNRGSDYQRRAVNECDNSSEIRELCQRCAKATKSKWAYPLCCEEEKENTRNFCRNFIGYPNELSNVP